MRYGRKEYEHDGDTFRADAYRVSGHSGIAWYVRGWEMEWRTVQTEHECGTCDGTGDDLSAENEEDATCEDCEGSGKLYYDEQEQCRTGQVVCVMVGDDRHWAFDPEDVQPLEREEYCGECGQIGCGHDGYDRSEVEA